jgi:predicted NAD/FAD-binding protein
MARIAIIGTGIAGLSAAYLLDRHHDITVYEKEPRIGGHTRTLNVRYGDRTIPVDTGFIVYNERNYPNLTALFRHLGVATHKSDMSFALSVRDGWLEWGAQGANSIFGQRRNIFRPSFLSLFRDVMRFNASALAMLADHPGLTLGEFIDRLGMSDGFCQHYILPMAGAIWSCPPRQMLAFPAETFVRFFANHGLLSYTGQPQWYTVSGGAQAYVDRLTSSFIPRIRTACAAVQVARSRGCVHVRDDRGGQAYYDHVVLASHSDQTLQMLTDASSTERDALAAIGYQRNRAVLHKSPQFMPRRRRCWASWNYHSDGSGDEAAVSVTYWMNRLQSIDERYPLFVTLNPSRAIAGDQIFDEHEFFHPVFDKAAIEAQSRLRALQGIQNTWFCGAFMGHGFHEDGLASAMDVAAKLGAPAPWLDHAVIAFPKHQTPASSIALPWGEAALAASARH